MDRMQKERDEYEQKLQEQQQQFEKAKREQDQLAKFPHLKNINADPAMSGMIKKAMRSGENVIGKQTKEFTPDIAISGVGIAATHCVIVYDDEQRQAHVLPNQEDPEKYQIKVNGNSIIAEPILLHHGDRLLVSTHHYYLYVDPNINAEESYEWQNAMKEANADQLKILDQDNGELEKIKAQAVEMRKEKEAQDKEMEQKMREFEEIRKKQELELEAKKLEIANSSANDQARKDLQD